MSLSALLNNDDQEIIPLNSKSAATISELFHNDKEEEIIIDPKQNFLNELNNRFKDIQERDKIELDYQDWKFLNYQEFELISEWNHQCKTDWNIQDPFDKFSFKQLYGLMSENEIEWNDYLKFKQNKAKLVKDLVNNNPQIKEIRRRGRKSHVQPNSPSHVNINEKSIKIKKEIGSKSSNFANEMDDNQLMDSINGDMEDDSDDEDEYDEDLADLEIPTERIELEENDSDKDFTPDDDRKKSKAYSSITRDKTITLESDRTKIVRELIKMCNKNKIPRVKKRRFTNALIMEYKPGQNYLQLKITLKQYHIKKLKRSINDAKRQKEKTIELARIAGSKLHNKGSNSDSPLKKKRKLNNSSTTGEADDDDSMLEHVIDRRRIPSHGLPTYGMKMSAKEARAIQRHYDNIYITVWKDMARKDSNKMVRLLQQIQSIKATNFKKTSSLCAREAKKWQARNFKQIKDFQTRAKRGIREMSNFWKKNEREEREIKKKQEKIALEQAKKEDDERESERQAKKLNFLLTQTELYSHFIGRKIKTDELEGNEKINDGDNNIDLETTDSSKKNNFHEIDFDNENDDALRTKAAENASNVLAQTRAKAKEFDNQRNEGEEDDDELNFQNPTSLGEITIEQPNLLACTLKEYQLKGLNWLANLYDQGINGILADEMGLGKTVQSISVLAHLAERYNIWGPFLVVTPASTLHNWVNEISKFVPNFKILPYWGNANDRKILRKFWDRKNVKYNKDSPFHVMITSYQMVVSDVSYLQKMRWQYMILDEAQAIKSSQSSRWKNLLSFHCRNRLLLTGTPIQNNMQELWALLHFIMPSLFDSHDEFSDWFAKDIESHAESNTQLNQQQLRRLHMILKPFMLRRIKKNVQSELGDKIEIDVLCALTQRQAKLYKVLRSQVSSGYDAIENAAGNDDFTGDQNLINTVMQFRKVCNHPDLFERADIESPFAFVTFGKSSSMLKNSSANGTNTMLNSVNNSSINIANFNTENEDKPMFHTLNALNYTDWVDVQYSSRNPITYNLPRLVYDELILPTFENNVDIMNKIVSYLFDIFNPTSNRELCGTLGRISGASLGEFSKISHMDILLRAIQLDSRTDEHNKDKFNKNLLVSKKTEKLEILSKQCIGGVLDSLLNIKRSVYLDEYMNSLNRAYHPAAAATPINIRVLGSSNFTTRLNYELFNPIVSQALSDIPPTTQYNMHVHKHISYDKFPKTNLYPEPLNKNFTCNISMPSMDRFITESAKLKKLDELLVKLKEEDHRVLVYFQMTKMMDLMEEYLTYRQYNYIRLDGSSKLEDRRDLVHDWQTKPEIFIFLLSTRAGGLGINLTAADTVIFYDSDWNPTIDSQAMDRAHRLGQTRQVTVYRLLVKDTIEERMRDRAKQKEQVQQVVMEGKMQEHNVKTIEASKEVIA